MNSMEGAAVEMLFSNVTADWNKNARRWTLKQAGLEETNDPRVLGVLNEEIWKHFSAEGPFGIFPAMVWFFSTPEKIVSPMEFLYFWSHLDLWEKDDIEARVMMVVTFGK